MLLVGTTIRNAGQLDGSVDTLEEHKKYATTTTETQKRKIETRIHKRDRVRIQKWNTRARIKIHIQKSMGRNCQFRIPEIPSTQSQRSLMGRGWSKVNLIGPKEKNSIITEEVYIGNLDSKITEERREIFLVWMQDNTYGWMLRSLSCLRKMEILGMFYHDHSIVIFRHYTRSKWFAI